MKNANMFAALALSLAVSGSCQTAFAAEVPKAEQERISHIAQSGMAEVKLGELAEKKASGAEVKEFAHHMVTDHGKANNELKTAAKEASVKLPADCNADQKATYESLSKLSGKEFDKKYISEMVKGHAKAVEAVGAESTEGTGVLKAWAEKTLPVIKEHQKHCDEMNTKM